MLTKVIHDPQLNSAIVTQKTVDLIAIVHFTQYDHNSVPVLDTRPFLKHVRISPFKHLPGLVAAIGREPDGESLECPRLGTWLQCTWNNAHHIHVQVIMRKKTNSKCISS